MVRVGGEEDERGRGKKMGGRYGEAAECEGRVVYQGGWRTNGSRSEDRGGGGRRWEGKGDGEGGQVRGLDVRGGELPRWLMKWLVKGYGEEGKRGTEG